MSAEKLAVFGGAPVRGQPLYYGRQYIDKDDIDAVVRVLKSDFLTCGPEIEKLEQKLCSLTGAKYAAAVSNGTAALHAACFAAGIRPGDEVITSPITFAASANAVLYCGGTPVFADIDPDTFNISAVETEKQISPRTKAVIAVDYTGSTADLHAIRQICARHNLIFIEDAAHSFGTQYNGKMVGNIADLTTFSFHPVKTVTGGEGGAVMTNDPKLYERLTLFRTHGITRSGSPLENKTEGPWYYEQLELGFNYRLTDFQAALISSQADKLERFITRRQEIVNQYDNAFSVLPAFSLKKTIPGLRAATHLYVLRINPGKLSGGRREIFDALKAENIICNVHYIPVYRFPYYQGLGYKKGLCPNAEAFYENAITLPLYYSMTDKDVADVISAVNKVTEYYSIR